MSAQAKRSDEGSDRAVEAAIFSEAADLIADPNNYVVAFTARRPDVNPEHSWACLASDSRADRWGMMGAIAKCAYKRKWTPTRAFALGYSLAADLGVHRLAEWAENPIRTHREVIEALKNAASGRALGRASRSVPPQRSE